MFLYLISSPYPSPSYRLTIIPPYRSTDSLYFLAHREILYAFFFTYPVVGILIPEPFIKYADLFPVKMLRLSIGQLILLARLIRPLTQFPYESAVQWKVILSIPLIGKIGFGIFSRHHPSLHLSPPFLFTPLQP